MKPTTKAALSSLHWAAQQTTIFMVFLFGLTAGFWNLVQLFRAASQVGDGELDPDFGNQCISQALLCFLIALILLAWYYHRKKKYQEDNHASE